MPISDDVLLVHGDCFDVMPKIPAESVDMVFADLPYAHHHGSRVRKCTDNSWDAPIDLPLMWIILERLNKSNGVFCFTASQPFASKVVLSRPFFRYDLIYKRTKMAGYLNANKQPMRNHEHVLIFYRGKALYCAQKTQGHKPRKIGRSAIIKSGNYGAKAGSANPVGDTRHPGSVLIGMDSDLQNSIYMRRLHPTQKPVALLEWLIKTYTNPGDLVLDPCSGSGTTAIAALNTGRRAICIEKDAGYHAAAVKRLADARRAPKQGTLALTGC